MGRHCFKILLISVWAFLGSLEPVLAAPSVNYDAGSVREISFLSDWSFFGSDKSRSSQPLEQDAVSHLVDTALVYVGYESVPYVWGGNSIGSPQACSECSQCILKNKKRGVRKRHLKCSACGKCGMDCSHFVQNVFESAGMPFPFMATRSFLRVNAKRPDKIPGLRYIGTDLSLAMPGDLLVQKKHVVILINKKSDSVGDIVHMSRTVREGKIGGIALRRDTNLKTFFGGVRKIFRHEKLFFNQTTSQMTPDVSDHDWALRTPPAVRHAE